MQIKWIFLILFLLFSNAVFAHELSFITGHVNPINISGSSYGWQINFRSNFHHYFAWSASYINEGHIDNHKRDGLAAQIWGGIPLFNNQFSLSLGGGAYRFYDTQNTNGKNFKNDHGLAQIYSISAAYYINRPLLVRFTANRIIPVHNHEMKTNSFMLGVGYDLSENNTTDADSSKNQSAVPQKTGIETTIFAGLATANNSRNQTGSAVGIEFRTGIMKYLDWTVTALHESGSPSIVRNALGSQIWLVNSYFNNRFVIGAGIGPFCFLNQRYSPKTKTRWLADGASIMTSYRFSNHWLARLAWNRLGTRYNHDSDEFLLGIGYSW